MSEQSLISWLTVSPALSFLCPMCRNSDRPLRNGGRLRWTRAVSIGLLASLALATCSGRGAIPQGERRERFLKSPQFREGRFQNPLPRWQAGYASILWMWIKGSEHSSPETEPPIQTRTAADFATPPADGLRVTWLGHSTVLLEIEGVRVLLDPVWSRRASPLAWIGPTRFHPAPLPMEELLRMGIDAVAISHDHYDHLDRDTIRALAKTKAVFLVPLGVGAHLERWGVPTGRIREFDWWEETNIGPVRVTATPSRHFSGRWITARWQDSTLWSGWAFRGRQRSAYYSGDTAMFPGFREIGRRLGPFDVTLIEVGQYNPKWPDVHLGPEQAVQAHRDVRGRVLVPVHWSTFELSLHTWTEPVERTLAAARDLVVFTPRPGQSVEPLRPPQTARWWPQLPWKTASEVPIVSTGLTSTAGVTPSTRANGNIASATWTGGREAMALAEQAR